MIGIAAQSIGFIILARFLGTEKYGYIVTITAVSNLAVAWCGLGATEAMRRRVARDPNEYSRALGHCLIMLGLTVIIVTIVVAALLPFLVRAVDDPWENFLILFLLGPVALALYAWINLAEHILLAHNNFNRANLVNAGFGIVRAVTVVVAFVGFGVDNLFDWAIWSASAYVVASIACVVVVLPYGWPRWALIREEIPLGFTLSVASAIGAVRQNIDLLALSAIETPHVVGAYGVTRRILATALTPAGSFDRLIYHKLAIAGKQGPWGTLRAAKRYAIYSIVIAGSTSVGLFLLAPLLPWVFGNPFAEAVFLLKILCWLLIFSALQNLAGDAFNAADEHRIRFVVGTVASVLGTTAIIALTFAYGVMGLLVAIYLSDGIMTIALWVGLRVLGRRTREGEPSLPPTQ